MGQTVTDHQVVSILRPFVRATAPVLDALRDADPLALRARAADAAARGETLPELEHVRPSRRRRLLRRAFSVKAPGTDAWTRMNPQQRIAWWINRVGRVTSLLTSVPGLGGALAARLPVQDVVGSAAQGLLLCAIAGELGIDDHADRVRLLAWVLFKRDVDPRLAAGEYPGHDAADEDVRTAELTKDIDAAGKRGISLKSMAMTLWRLGRSLTAFADELQKRPRGRFWHRWIGLLPGIGMIAGYLGERSALKRAAKAAYQWRAHSRRGTTART